MKDLNCNSINNFIKENSVNILYGAGQNGRKSLNLLQKFGIKIKGFYDDDSSRWNEKFCGYNILEKSAINELYEKEKVNFILTNNYINNSYKNLLEMGVKDDNVFTLLEYMIEWDIEKFNLERYVNGSKIKNKIEAIANLFKDYYSKQYFALITNLFSNRVDKLRLKKILLSLFCQETQYFLDDFKYWLSGKIILDIGAYTGDSISEIYKKSIVPNHIYSFEANYSNYLKLLSNMDLISWKNRVTCINRAVWNKEEKLYFKNNGFNAKVLDSNDLDVTKGGGYNETLSCNTIIIDNYCRNLKTDFIKMDIEGAELKALKGSKMTILRDRPILAISIYHSIDDIINVPLFLFENLINYTCFLKHHSYTFSETIMYCVPNELNKDLKNYKADRMF